MPISCIERVLVAVADLEDACERWSKAGFAIASKRIHVSQFDVAELHAGAVGIDLIGIKDIDETPPMFTSVLQRGGGIVGWAWGIDDAGSDAPSDDLRLRYDGFTNFLPGVWTTGIATHGNLPTRRANLEQLCGANENTVDYLEHIVVMTPSLEDAIAAHEKIGLPCKRIREAGGGVRQAFFKLEQTVMEIVGPGRGTPQVWGLAFMCKDIRRAVDLARANGMEATEPKIAIQGGKIGRIVAPLDGVAIAYMEPA